MFRCSPLSLTGLGLGSYPSQFHRHKFNKSHHFDVVNKIPLLADAHRPKIGGTAMFEIKTPAPMYPKSGKSLKPSWLVYEKQVLRFFGYFKDTLPEARTKYQIRKVKIMYYLEDDTIQVIEPHTDDSGISSQGCIVSRQRIKKYRSNECITLLDLNVNQPITLLDRVYAITDCDAFTRNFLNRLGISVPSPCEIPKDPGTELRRIQKEAMAPKYPTAKDFRFAKFLQNDRNVLRFTGYWEEQNSSVVRILEVLYHLADDTIEIKEKLPPNSGRISNGMFLKRAKLPKQACKIRDIGEGNFCVLNVLGRDALKGNFLKDRLDIGFGDDSQYYKETDLGIGRTINVFGRDVTLTDCDGHTREFYSDKYGVSEFHPLPIPLTSINTNCDIMNEKKIPPYNGWGSYEDSEANCKGIESKAPKIDFNKFLRYDKLILRFGANMISNVRENNERLFVISYHLSDDTISVFELCRRDSGFAGGEFFGKSKFYLPGQEKFTSEPPIAYKSQDLYLGATVYLRTFCFKIVSADLFALKFMEDHKELYPMSHAGIITSKVREKMRPIYKDFIANYMTKVKTIQNGDGDCEFMAYDDFKMMLKDLMCEQIVEHEILTLCRHYGIKQKKCSRANREAMRSIIHGILMRELWDDLERLKEYLYHLSPERSDHLSEQQILTTIRACRIPIDPAITRQLFAVLNRNECDEIEVQDFLNFLNLKSIKTSPVPPVNPKVNQFKYGTDEGNLIDWKMFIEAIDLEENLKLSD